MDASLPSRISPPMPVGPARVVEPIPGTESERSTSIGPVNVFEPVSVSRPPPSC